jgi:hypothetical protein
MAVCPSFRVHTGYILSRRNLLAIVKFVYLFIGDLFIDIYYSTSTCLSYHASCRHITALGTIEVPLSSLYIYEEDINTCY